MNEPENVAHFIRSLDVGGAEKMLEKIAFCTKDSQYPAEVWSSERSGPIYNSLTNSKIKYQLFNFKNFKLKQFRTLKKVAHAKLIQGWMYEANILCLLLAKIYKKPVVWNIRQSLDTFHRASLKLKIAIYISSKLSRYADAIIYNSKRSMLQHEAYGFDPKVSRLIPNGFIIPQKSVQNNSHTELKDRLNIPHSSKIILSIGRKHYDKGQDLLVAAANKVIDTNENIHFVFIGRNMNYKSKKNIHFLNEVSETEAYYLGANIFVLTSRAESFPNVLGEAMSYGLPCISTNVGDCSIILDNKQAIIDDLKSDSIASTILDFINKPDQELQNIGIKNRQRIIDSYSLNKISNDYIELYEKLLRG